METWQETFRQLDTGARYSVRLPDGTQGTLWGYNGATGDLYISGWRGDAWMDCTSGSLRVTFA